MSNPTGSPAFLAWLEGLPEHEREAELAFLRGEFGNTPTIDPANAYGRAGEISADLFGDIRGSRPVGLSPSEQNELSRLQEREARLQPAQLFAPGALGSDMRNNPFGVDTRGISTGLANFALSLVNRERNRRLAGDTRKIDEANNIRSQAASFAEPDVSPQVQRPGQLLGRQAGVTDMAGQVSNDIQAQSPNVVRNMLGEAESLEREGLGVRGRAGQLRARQEAAQQYDEEMISWLERVSPGLGERILRHASEESLIRQREDRDVRAASRDDAYRRGRLNLEYQLREGLERSREALRANPEDPQTRSAVWSEVYTMAKTLVPEYTILPGQIQNAQMMLRNHINNRPSFSGGSVHDAWVEQRKELEENLAGLIGKYQDASREVHRQLQNLRYGDLTPVVEEIEEEVVSGTGSFDLEGIDRRRGIPGLPSGVPQPIDTGIEWK